MLGVLAAALGASVAALLLFHALPRPTRNGGPENLSRGFSYSATLEGVPIATIASYRSIFAESLVLPDQR